MRSQKANETQNHNTFDASLSTSFRRRTIVLCEHSAADRHRRSLSQIRAAAIVGRVVRHGDGAGAAVANKSNRLVGRKWADVWRADAVTPIWESEYDMEC